MYYHYTMDPCANDTISNLSNENRPFGRFSFISLLRLLKEDVLFERRVELHELDLAFHGFLILARPYDVRRLRGFEFKQAVL